MHESSVKLELDQEPRVKFIVFIATQWYVSTKVIKFYQQENMTIFAKNVSITLVSHCGHVPLQLTKPIISKSLGNLWERPRIQGNKGDSKPAVS